MKSILKTLAPGLLAFVLLGSTAWAQNRVATVNLQKVFDKYWRTDTATAQLKERANELDKTHQEKVDGWKKAKSEHQQLLDDANNQAISAEEREKRKQAADEKLKTLKQMEDDILSFERYATTEVSEQKARMRKGILEEIQAVVKSKAEAGGYSQVLDSGAQTYVADPSGPYYTPTLLYWNNANDLTDAVIAQLNIAAPIKSQSTDQKKPESKSGK